MKTIIKSINQIGAESCRLIGEGLEKLSGMTSLNLDLRY